MRTSDAPAALRRAPGALLLVLLIAGCGGSAVTFAPVEGTVTRNGRPVPRAQVIFYAEAKDGGPRAVGLTDETGAFRLAADDGRDGAPVGSHRVCVIDTAAAIERLSLIAKHASPEAAGKAPLAKGTGKGAAVPPEYSRPAETPLRAEVRPGPQTINFQIP